MKTKYKIIDIKDYIVLEHPSIFREYLVVCIFIISFFGTIFAICDPFTPYQFNILISIIVVMDLFAIFILSNVEKWQKLYILFIGIYCFALSVILYMIFYKIIFLILKITAPLLFVFSIAVYILILIVSFIMLLNALKTGCFSGARKSKGTKGAGVIAAMSGAGVLIGRLLITSTGHQTFLLITAFFTLLWSYIMIFGMHNIYKYYLIKKYEEYVHLNKLEKKKKKKR